MDWVGRRGRRERGSKGRKNEREGDGEGMSEGGKRKGDQVMKTEVWTGGNRQSIVVEKKEYRYLSLRE